MNEKTFCSTLVTNNTIRAFLIYFIMYRASKIEFKVKMSWNTEKHCWPPWLKELA